ncbi:hypothetical protein ACWA6H_09625 [Pseudomonas bijieensis]
MDQQSVAVDIDAPPRFGRWAPVAVLVFQPQPGASTQLFRRLDPWVLHSSWCAIGYSQPLLSVTAFIKAACERHVVIAGGLYAIKVKG